MPANTSRGAARLTRRNLLVGLSGFVGGVVAVLADVLQKGDASATLKMSQILQDAFSIPFPPILAAAFVAVLATVLCFIFECETRLKAFYLGASVLSIIMTLVPYELPPSIPRSPSEASSGVRLEPRSGRHTFGPALAFARSAAGSQPFGQVHVRLAPVDSGRVEGGTITVNDRTSGRIVGKSRLSGEAFDFVLPVGTYEILIEVPGYAVERRRVDVREPRQDVQLRVPLEPSMVPLPFQRLYKR